MSLKYRCWALTEFVIQRTHGVDVCLPNNAEAILVAEYGKNWRIPDAKRQEEDASNLNECTKSEFAIDLVRMQIKERATSKEEE